MGKYTIRAVSKKVRDYETQYGAMKSYKVAFIGEGVEADEAVEISQKASTPPPKEGDVLEGTIEDGQFGKKFRKDFTAGGFRKGHPRDDDSIKAQFAIKAAIATGLKDPVEIEALAIDLFAMVERVKGTASVTKPADVFGDTEPVEESPFDGMDLA